MFLDAKYLSNTSLNKITQRELDEARELFDATEAETAGLMPESERDVTERSKTKTQKSGGTPEKSEAAQETPRWRRFSILRDTRFYRIIPKMVYLMSVMSLIFVTYCIFEAPWMLPYYYTVSVGLLMWIRFIMYWRRKMLFFMLDFCYFATVMILMFIWIMPQNEVLFSMAYGLANGPLLWAVVIYRNSIVFHSIDKITSAFIHIMPAILTFSLRWRPGETSRYWYREMVPRQEPLTFSSIVVIPLVIFFCHTIMYVCLVYVILKPSDEHMTSYSHLAGNEGTPFFKAVNIFGEKYRMAFFVIFNWVFCLISLLLACLLYALSLVNVIVVTAAMCISVYNGGSYYIDVFSVRGTTD